MTCKDCIHYKICLDNGDDAAKQNAPNAEKECEEFKNKADFVEVPYRCETCVRKKGKVNECGDVYCILHKGYFDRDAFCSYGERKNDFKE